MNRGNVFCFDPIRYDKIPTFGIRGKHLARGDINRAPAEIGETFVLP